jgi:hypothetical protein
VVVLDPIDLVWLLLLSHHLHRPGDICANDTCSEGEEDA